MSVKGRSKREIISSKKGQIKFPHNCSVNVHGTNILVPSIGPTWEEGEKKKTKKRKKKRDKEKDEQTKKKNFKKKQEMRSKIRKEEKTTSELLLF